MLKGAVGSGLLFSCAVAVVAGGCGGSSNKHGVACDEPGLRERCVCTGEADGTRICQDDGYWSDCDCETIYEEGDAGSGGSGPASGGTTGDESGGSGRTGTGGVRSGAGGSAGSATPAGGATDSAGSSGGPAAGFGGVSGSAGSPAGSGAAGAAAYTGAGGAAGVPGAGGVAGMIASGGGGVGGSDTGGTAGTGAGGEIGAGGTGSGGEAGTGGASAGGNQGSAGSGTAGDQASGGAGTGGNGTGGNAGGAGTGGAAGATGADGSTVALFHFDGPDGGTELIDSSGLDKQATIVGNPQISTAESKFGGASLYINGDASALTNYVTIAGGADFTFPADFTVDWWQFINMYTDTWGGIIALIPDGSYSSETTVASGWQSGGTYLQYHPGSYWVSRVSAPTTSVWHHIALSRADSTFRVFIDGLLVYADDSITDTVGGTRARISATVSNSDNGDFNGYIDEVRVVNGAAMWTGDFTPPTAPYPDP